MGENIYKNKLKEGDIFSSYKKLCEHLGEPRKTGNSRNAQYKEWQRHFDYEKDGHKYVIVELYSKPLPKDDKRIMGNASKFIPYIEFILLHYLAKQEGKVAAVTSKQLFYILGMCNEQYLTKYLKVSEEEGINDAQIQHFSQRSFRKLSGILSRALNSLKNRRLIDFQKVKMIGVDLDYNGKGTYRIRQATVGEEDIIRKVERETLVDMGFRSVVQVYLKYKSNEFFNRVEEKLKTRYGILFYYSQLNLRFTHEQVLEAIDIDKEKFQLNSEVANSLNQEAETKFSNNLKKLKEAENSQNNNDEAFEFGDDYVSQQAKLVEIFIQLQEK